MKDLTVQHYLKIYETRLSMTEKGITHPAPKVVASEKRLVAALRRMKPEEKIHLDAGAETAIFTRAATGDLVGQIDLK
jgi:hypothetical protein